MEADGLRWSLLIIGSLVIVGLAVHGIWLSRKNSEQKTTANKRKNDQEYQPSGWQSDTDMFDDVANETNDLHQDSVDDSNAKFDIEDETPIVANSEFKAGQFDDLGLGAVRVVSREHTETTESKGASSVSQQSQTKAETHSEPEPEPEPEPELKLEPEPVAPTSKIYASVVTQPKPEYAAKYTSLAAETVAISQQERASSNHHESAKVRSQQVTGNSNPGANSSNTNSGAHSNDSYQAPEPPPFLLKKDVPDSSDMGETNVAAEQTNKAGSFSAVEPEKPLEKPEASLAEKLSLSEQARNLVKRKRTETIKKRREPKIAEDQMRIDFDDEPVPAPEPEPQVQAKAEPAETHQPQEVLVLNVKSADDNPILGSALLPMLLTLGFKFGDQDIFHRHVNSNGKGPVLFSLANMFKPGNFDIDNLENFTTQGISLFMILPIEGDPHQVFNMMHNAARKIAEEFSAQIYDAKRTLLSKQSLQQYVEKIREFERQRLLKG
ncbi:MAG: cell division protein ZipA [Paraglaciecola sp.]|uniref:cell division protein ZipA n=1 Tax=Paraglaciecola sp. TaxID=1920173 RepID=UPI003299D5A0